jgi:6-phosphogluconolactonase (cycloisomerase 2 family)
MRINSILRPLSVAAFTLGISLGVAGIAGATGATTRHADSPSAHALFIQTDGTAGNRILAYQRAADGTVSLAGTYATGGLGAVAAGATADPLASQGSLALVRGGRDLIAVNAGSNSISVFAVKGVHLTLKQKLASGGTFPNSVTSSGNLVAVLDAGGAGAIAEFSFSGGTLKALPAQTRSLGFTNPGAAPASLAEPGQIDFTPSGGQLVIATKKATLDTTSTPATPSTWDVFSVGPSGVIGATPTVTPSQNPAPFGFEFDAAGHLVATEAGNSSVATYTVNADGTLSAIGNAPDGQKALCWVSVANGIAYGENAGSGNISTFSIAGNGTPTLLNATAATAHAGTTDSAVDPSGSFLYVESGGDGTLDVYGIGAGGTLAQIETVFNVPAASEGIAVS